MRAIREIHYNGFAAVELETEWLKAIVLPELGGKIISLLNKTNGFDCTFVNPFTGLVRYPYDAAYVTTDCGIGDLFPSIAVGFHTDGPWKGIPLPDKGEIWTQPMETVVLPAGLAQTTFGVRFPYRFVRKLEICEHRIILDYTLENLCPFDFKYIWSLQPHLRISGNMEIVAAGTPSFYVDWSRNHSFEAQERLYSWPRAHAADSDREIDFSRIGAMTGDAEKLYLTGLDQGVVSLHYDDEREAVTFRFDPSLIPNCGLWINKEGWPIEGNRTKLVAIQPCNCMSDFFDVTDRHGVIGTVKGKEENRWRIEIEVTSL
ncbi:MAG: hypothetical protein ACLQDL_02520 [Spirochaetia bacterium]